MTYECSSHSSNIKSHETICSPEVIVFSVFDIGISYKKTWLSLVQIILDELTTNLQGVKVFMLGGWEVCSYALIPSISIIYLVQKMSGTFKS